MKGTRGWFDCSNRRKTNSTYATTPGTFVRTAEVALDRIKLGRFNNNKKIRGGKIQGGPLGPGSLGAPFGRKPSLVRFSNTVCHCGSGSVLQKRPSFFWRMSLPQFEHKFDQLNYGWFNWSNSFFCGFDQLNHPWFNWSNDSNRWTNIFELKNYPQKRFDQVQFDVLSFDLPTSRQL